MPEIPASLHALAQGNAFLAYLLVYVGTIFAGNVWGFLGLFLSFQGYFGALWGTPIVLAIIFAAQATGDVLWYSLGRTLRDTRLGGWVKRHLPRHREIETHLKENGRRWVLLGKFVVSASPVIAFSVGWSKMSFATFIKTSLAAIALWLPVLGGASYGLVAGISQLQFIPFIKRFEWFLTLGVAFFIVVSYLLSRIMRRFLAESSAQVEI